MLGTTELPDNCPVRRRHTLAFEKSRLGAFRRGRRAFAFARTCQGSRKAVQSEVCLDRASAEAVRKAADIFSSTIREPPLSKAQSRAGLRVRLSG